MSKLLLQLKQAQALREQARGEALPPASPAASSPQGASPGVPGRRLPVAAASLALVIFLGVVFAWRAAPWKIPPKIRIDPAALKLEHRLDITRLRQTKPH